MLPKIVHQIWLGHDDPPTDWMQTWVEFAYNADWDYQLWTNDTIPPLENYKAYNFYMAHEEWHGAADVARVEILERYGGWYMDADIELIDPLGFGTDPMQFANFVVTEHPTQHDRFPNGVIGSVPGHPVLSRYVDIIARHVKVDDLSPAWATVGGNALYEAIMAGSEPFHVTPTAMFLPFHFGKRYTHPDVDTYAIHHQYTTRRSGVWNGQLPEYREEDL